MKRSAEADPHARPAKAIRTVTETMTGWTRGVNLDALLCQSYFQKRRLRQEALKLYEKSEFRDAEQRSLELLEIAQQTRDIFYQATALQIAGDSQEKMKNFQASLRNYKKVLALLQTTRDVKTVKGQALHKIGVVYYQLGEHREAEKFLKDALDVKRQLGDKRGQGRVCGDLGNVHYSLGNYEEAIKWHQYDLRIAQRWNDKRGQAKVYGNIGNALNALGQYKEAIKNHQKSLNIVKQLDDRPEQGRAYGRLGISYRDMGYCQKAIKCHLDSLDIAQEEHDEHGQGTACCNLGIAYSGLGRYLQAIEYHEKDLGFAQKLNDEPGKGRAYVNLGSAYYRLGNYEKSVEYHHKALDIMEKRGDERRQGTVYCNLGISFNEMGQYKTAIKHYEKHLAIVKQLDDKPGQARAYCNLGEFYKDKGEYNKAIEYHKRDLKISRELDDKLGQGRAYGNLGSAHNGLGEFKRAIEWHKLEISIAKKFDAKPLLIDAHKNFGQVYLDIGDLQNADKHFSKMLELANELENDPMRCSAYSGLGSTHLRMKKHDDALGYYEDELRIAQKLEHEPSLARAYSDLGRVFMERKEYSRAIKYYEKDMDISKSHDSQPGLKRVHGNLGDVYKREGDYTKAIEHHQAYLKMAEQLGDRPAQVRAQANLGLERFRSGNIALAFGHFTMFGEYLSDLEKQLAEGQWRRHLMGFVENYADCMDAWVAAAAQADDMLAALRVEEWRRCRSELPYLSENGNGKGVTVDGLQDIAKRVDAAFIVVFKVYEDTLMTWVLSGESGELVYKKRVHSPGQNRELSELVASATFKEWTEWQQAFAKIDRWIKYVEKTEGSVVEEDQAKIIEWVIQKVTRGDLDERLFALIRDPSTYDETVPHIEKHFFEKAENAMKRLSGLLWEPILESYPVLREKLQGDISSTKPIYFLPDSFLSPIPFCALKTDDCFLIEKTPVAQASSLRTLDYARERWRAICKEPQSPSGALIVSYEESPEIQVSTAWEFERLKTVLPATTLSDLDATKETVIERVTSGSASLIHFLVHGTQMDREKQWAGLCLANREVLSASELNEHFTERNPSSKVSLTRLMVLCACSSGRGLHMGEGVQGFGRTALAGGIPCLLASKWEIPTKISIILMTLVYASMALNKGKYQTVAEALQTAVKSFLRDEIMRDKKSFYYWAAFISHGFASVLLDDKLLAQIHAGFETL